MSYQTHMNIYINNYCNQQCPYCFASDYMDEGKRKEMSIENFDYVLEFLRRENYNHVRFEGGEPTLHARFMDFVDFALAKGFRIMLFTNGLFGRQLQDFLAQRRAFIHYTWNINAPSLYSRGNWLRLKNNLSRLALRNSCLGVNIYSLDQDLDYMVKLCRDLRPFQLRCVFAHQLGGRRIYQTIPLRDLRAFTPKIAKLVQTVGKELNVPSFFDCGFIPCVWSDQDLAILMRYGVFLQGCETCPGIDPDLNVSHCFHIDSPKERMPLAAFNSIGQINTFLQERKDRYNKYALFPECRNCVSKKIGACDGGCLGDRRAAAKGWLK
jgi:sulfatase maturation enzyme AslB (radical SAM superfamily)